MLITSSKLLKIYGDQCIDHWSPLIHLQNFTKTNPSVDEYWSKHRLRHWDSNVLRISFSIMFKLPRWVYHLRLEVLAQLFNLLCNVHVFVLTCTNYTWKLYIASRFIFLLQGLNIVYHVTHSSIIMFEENHHIKW